MLVALGALVVLLVIAGGILMARLLTNAATLSDVWRSNRYRDEETGR